MKKFSVTFGSLIDGADKPPRNVRVLFSSDGRDTVCKIQRAGLVSGWESLSHGLAMLAEGDLFSFNAGCRIAFDRAWRGLDWTLLDPEFVKQLRRAVQIELAIEKVDAKGRSLDKALRRAADEYVALLELRANGYTPRKTTNLDGLIEALRRASAKLMQDAENVSQHHGDPSKVQGKDEPLAKPDAYKNVRSTETGKSDFPVKTYPKGPGPLPCFHIVFGVSEDDIPSGCAECAGDAECCAKHGGVL